MKRTVFFLISAALILALAGCGNAPAPTAPETDSPEAPEPTASTGILSDFSTVDLEGNEVGPAIFEGYDLTMVNVWATYCGPCLQEMPDLAALAEEYADKGVRIVGLVSDVLNSDGTVSDQQVALAQEIAASTGATYLHLVPSPELFGLLSQITAVPTTFFVDDTGAQVGTAYLGARSGEDWAAIIDQTLAEAAS